MRISGDGSRRWRLSAAMARVGSSGNSVRARSSSASVAATASRISSARCSSSRIPRSTPFAVADRIRPAQLLRVLQISGIALVAHRGVDGGRTVSSPRYAGSPAPRSGNNTRERAFRLSAADLRLGPASRFDELAAAGRSNDVVQRLTASPSQLQSRGNARSGASGSRSRPAGESARQVPDRLRFARALLGACRRPPWPRAIPDLLERPQ